MRGLISEIDIHTPRNLKEALAFLSTENKAEGVWKILAGCTDIGVEFNAGHLRQKKFLNIWNLRSQLGKIELTPQGVTIGALCTFTEIQNSQTIQKYFPSLVQSCRLIGGVQIQNRGTLGGNIANASPAADSVPPVFVYGGILNLQSQDGLRKISISEFYKGYKKLDLKPDEIIISVQLPKPPKGTRHYFRKVGTRQAQAISKVVAAGICEMDKKGQVNRFRFSLGSVGPCPLRCAASEDYLEGRTLPSMSDMKSFLMGLRGCLEKDISPRDDIRSTRSYREFVSGKLLEDFVCGLQGGQGHR